MGENANRRKRDGQLVGDSGKPRCKRAIGPPEPLERTAEHAESRGTRPAHFTLRAADFIESIALQAPPRTDSTINQNGYFPRGRHPRPHN
eukprot:3124952-Pyramimonas_sp.AAC.1